MNSSLNREGGQYVCVPVCVSVCVGVWFGGGYGNGIFKKKIISEATTLKKQSYGIKMWLLRTRWAIVSWLSGNYCFCQLGIKEDWFRVHPCSLFYWFCWYLNHLVECEQMICKLQKHVKEGTAGFTCCCLQSNKYNILGRSLMGDKILTCVMSLSFHIHSHTLFFLVLCFLL